METFKESDTAFTSADQIRAVGESEEKSAEYLVWGQMKLLLTELQFLTLYWDPNMFPNPLIIVPGGAPGYSFMILADMFPSAEFHLFDPAFKSDTVNVERLRSKKNIVVIDKYFTLDSIEEFKKQRDRGLFLMSDIRNTAISGYREKKMEVKESEIIADDNSLALSWVLEMRPHYAHLKFDIPCIHKESHYKYLKGTIYKQPFTRPKSHETRLVVTKPQGGLEYEMYDYDGRGYKGMMKTFHVDIRGKKKYRNLINGSEGHVWPLQFTGDYDTTYMGWIILQFLDKVQVERTSDNLIGMAKNLIKGVEKRKIDEGMFDGIHTMQRIRRDFFRTWRVSEQKREALRLKLLKASIEAGKRT